MLQKVLHRQMHRRKLHNTLHAWRAETTFLLVRAEHMERAKLHYYERLWVKCLRGCDFRPTTQIKGSCLRERVSSMVLQFLFSSPG